MLYSYLKIAIRNLLRHKVYSFINIAGLALGMGCSLLIFLWIKDELRYDNFHQNGPRLYRVMSNLYWGDVQTTINTPEPLADVLQQEIPEVERVVKVINWDIEDLFTVGEKVGKETKGRYAGPDFFKLFTFPLVQGNSTTALRSPASIVISQRLAQKYFGSQNPIGNTIELRNNGQCQVTGVMQNIPDHSSMQFDFVLPIAPYIKQNNWLKGWGNFSLTTFIMLRPNATQEMVEAKIKNLVKKNNPGAKEELFLQPYTQIYLYTYKAGKIADGRIEYVWLFSLVSVFVLIIACINFMNLATARSAQRAKEIGIRKVVGATRLLLIGQFIGEAILIALLAVGLSFVLVNGLLPTFNQLTGKNIVIHYHDPTFWLLFTSIGLVTGLISGSYPALFLSALHPVKVLKGTLKFNFRALLFREGLVVFQFALSLLLIVGTVVVYQQINYIRSKNLGFDRENLVSVRIEGNLDKNRNILKQELLQFPSITALTTISDNPLQVDNSSRDLKWPGKTGQGAPAVAATSVDYDFIRTMRIPMKEGRDFSPDFATDSTAYIINESAARMMNMREPLGQTISFWNGSGKIIGVTKDFHIQSLHEPIRPLILMLNPRNASQFLVRVAPGKTAEALTVLQRFVRKNNPQYPFEYHFLDAEFEQQYKSEIIVSQLTTYFAVLAICISCLGLFGLALFTAEQRTKEIGIRKVLGASVSAIVAMLSKDFLKLVLLANILMWPLAAYVMHNWLQKFAYRIQISTWVFVLAGGLTLLIALLTISVQAIRAATTNPVKALRNE